ncbi:hypothetical protein [Nocardia sp. NPDC050175]|uniref:hypothetical protein n=1 Tax=Nocardia sp. NPDC050175 TaxID=3364317 RepID=UPI00379C0814
MSMSKDAYDDVIQMFVDAWVEREGMTRIDIEQMSLPELREAYSSVAFGQAVNQAAKVAEKLSRDPAVQNEIGDRLSRRLTVYRRMVGDRIEALSQQEQVEEFKGAVEAKVQDPQLRQELIDLISEFAKEQQKLAIESHAEDSTTEMQQALRSAELRERKWRLWKSMLTREPVAVLVGAVLLGLMTLAMIVAMFIHTTTPEIFSSALLLVLGFFFGQAAGGSNTSN